MDITYSVFETPIGIAVALCTPSGLAGLRFAEHDGAIGVVLRDTAERHGLVPRALDDSADDVSEEATSVRDLHALVRRELDEYFAGTREEFDTPLDLDTVKGVARAALTAIRSIPYGETASYGEVAVLAGAPGAARAVGTACATTPISVVVPVHRVVRADGSLGEYGGRPQIKRYLIELEQHRAAGDRGHSG